MSVASKANGGNPSLDCFFVVAIVARQEADISL